MLHTATFPPAMTDEPAALRSACGDSGQWCVRVSAPKAERVLLVREDECGLSCWHPMLPTARRGEWEYSISGEALGRSLRYYTVEAGAVLDCGTAGLSARRVAS